MHHDDTQSPFWATMVSELSKKGYSYEKIAHQINDQISAVQGLVENTEQQPSPVLFKKLFCLYYRELYCSDQPCQSTNWQRFRYLKETAGLPNDWMECQRA